MAWNRMWVQVFGSTAASTSTVLAVFMLGLGLGAYHYAAIGRLLRARGARLYLRLEVLVALGALAMPLVLDVADAVHLAAARHLGLAAPALHLVRVLLALAALLPPTMAMGATLPALADEVRGRGALEAGALDAEAQVARLYAWNTTGAVLGVALGGYLLIPELGLRACLVAAFLAEGTAAFLVRNAAHVPPPEESAPSGARDGWVVAVYAFVGFWSMALEVVSTRVVLTSAGSTSTALAAVLIAFLAGIALGARVAGHRPTSAPATALGHRLALAGLVAAGVAAVLPWLNHLYLRAFGTVGGALGGELATAAVSVAVLLPLGLAFGALFPVATRCLMAGGAGRAVARAYLANSVAGALGALVAFRLVVPHTGVGGAFAAASAALLLAGALVLARRAARPRPAAAYAALAVMVAFLGSRQPLRLDRSASRMTRQLRPGASLSEALDTKGELGWYRDGADASVAIHDYPTGNRSLSINGKGDADLVSDMQAQVSLGTLPMLLAPEGAEVLMFGLGAGGSADAALRLPVGRLDVAELCPTVHAASSRAFSSVFPRGYQDPRATIHHLDGRLLVRGWPRRVDVICSEPTNLYVQGVANLYTVEFFEACRERLKPGGLLVQWIQAYDLDEESLRRTVRSLAATFPHLAVAWFDDFFFLASDAPIRFDLPTIRRRLAAPEVREALRRARLPASAEALAGRFLASRRVLASWAGPGPLLTDDHPALEFRTARLRFRDTYPDFRRILTQLRAHPEYDRVLPLTGLLEPGPEGGRLYSVAQLRLGPELSGGRAAVERVPRAGLPGVLGLGDPKVATWFRRQDGGHVRVRAFPRDVLGTPRRPLEELARLSPDPPPLLPATVHGHGAHWVAVRTGEHHQARLAWLCPEVGATYLVEAEAARAEGDRALLEAVTAELSCLHGPREGPRTWGRGTLLDRAR
jgi:spermidine synthase